ncbi:MAG: hypothetical protein A3B91_02930 [Candidatus Yanofskybacteria bacterium RIFCSPHIGHO2_02_FULL_41_29]|uniref:Uncharacterized protein n=1 Tax=Candidatus Yanofskybacteria bacterium RIFCSPHIGHO2_01_FULL_41_53 TaxID=1802663 RepID=A0A1F8EJN6_9BACT|nr:MAG: hypothetical protein A2650_02280 [Candidatus Yanofskybacteria bacterium RIFCSPHIGHO2_01_FULL_41_53]OGN12218.1 MAG: hypothetical protein A3B91_02930 [Candidatus Yanofskybacteria bacterium RIFCSPHIGHO2_02_FULL_41_29]OGN18960.1 MAG: hypothetical protein A3F48_03875 [Candidatus Yanofskybacteria bacterium RIFCSPHIGHO2_12_FULL_41_9]OGN23832.1 MAG: hypothetical protein A2916_01210 [Candidatus Yanofskybacteria bacterium RIFCSPLOWO2_01_FULL_41_67]OGN28568.1 MAG: hypothetical protein A3H54_04915 
MDLDYKSFRTSLSEEDENFWIKEGERMALGIFYSASKRVPAYKDFLLKNKVKPDKIKSISDFKLIPVIDKENYLQAYPFAELCWDGNPGKMDMFSLSSGSTGEPMFWPRGKEQEEETALVHELFLVDSFEIDRYSTLLIVSFAMGMWVAGTLTHRATQSIAERYQMTVVTPGINKSDVLGIITSIGGNYNQIIIAGYPPFVKDIVDEGEAIGLNWKKYRIKFLFAAEAFSENWRDYLYKKVGTADILKGSLNIYGTADALILGHETPLSILARRIANKRQDIYKTMFSSEERIPTLIQYNPALRYFEQIGQNLIFTASSGIPLIRYSIGDSGGLVSWLEMEGLFSKYKLNLIKEAKNQKISIWRLPFLYVFGRDNFTATLYGVNIYPETVRESLSLEGVNDHVSGKFTMLTKNDGNFNQYLEVNVELKNVTSADRIYLKNKVKKDLVGMLRSKNNEYNELYKSLGKKAEPEVRLCSYGDKRFFGEGIKQKWTTRLR